MGEKRGCWRISGKVTPIKPLMSILSHVNHKPFFPLWEHQLPLVSESLAHPVSAGACEKLERWWFNLQMKKLNDAGGFRKEKGRKTVLFKSSFYLVWLPDLTKRGDTSRCGLSWSHEQSLKLQIIPHQLLLSALGWWSYSILPSIRCK